MSDDSQGSDEKNNTKKYLERVNYGYVFNLTGGLYKPQANHHEKEIEKDASESEKQIPIFVTVRTSNNWVSDMIALAAVLVSLLTVFLLAATVNFAKRQWHEMHEATIQSTRAADAARDAVGEADASLKQSRDQFAQDQRPYLWLDDEETAKNGGCIIDRPGSGSNSGKLNCGIWFRNFGKSPAIKTHSTAYISTAKNMEDDIRFDKLENDGGGIYPPGSGFQKNARSLEIVDPFILAYTHTANPEVPNRFAIHTLIEYFDQSGNRYVSELCDLMQANGHTKRCKDHNKLSR